MRSLIMALPLISTFLFLLYFVSQKSLPTQPWIANTFLFGGIFTLGLWLYRSKKKLTSLFSRKGSKYGVSASFTALLGVILIVGLAFVTSRPSINQSWDVTRSRQNTLSDQSHKLIQKLKDAGQELSVVSFFLDPQKKQQFSDHLSLYQREGLPVRIEYIDPQEDPTRAISENVTTADTVIVKLGEKEARLTSFTEEKISNAFVTLLKSKTKRIAFTKGHGEKRSDE